MNLRTATFLLGCLILVIVAGFYFLQPAMQPAADLSQSNCQIGDLPGDLNWISAPGNETPFDHVVLGETAVFFHSVGFSDISLTYQSITCTLVQFEDEPAAQRAFDRSCDVHALGVELMAVGDENCSFGSGVVSFNLRQGDTLVLIVADSDGSNGWRLAQAVNGRLEN